MNRRKAIAIIGTLIAAITAKIRPASATWGPMSVARHRALKHRGIDLHVYQHGVDVTSRCCFFDDTPGCKRARLFLHKNGRAYLNDERTGVAKEDITDFVVRRIKVAPK